MTDMEFGLKNTFQYFSSSNHHSNFQHTFTDFPLSFSLQWVLHGAGTLASLACVKYMSTSVVAETLHNNARKMLSCSGTKSILRC